MPKSYLSPIGYTVPKQPLRGYWRKSTWCSVREHHLHHKRWLPEALGSHLLCIEKFSLRYESSPY